MPRLVGPRSTSSARDMAGHVPDKYQQAATAAVPYPTALADVYVRLAAIMSLYYRIARKRDEMFHVTREEAVIVSYSLSHASASGVVNNCLAD